MALRRRGDRGNAALIWPGFVDAMTALLLVLMFLLSIFMIVQFVLREQLTGKDRSLAQLTAQVGALTDQLAAADARAEEFEAELSTLGDLLAQERARAKDLALQSDAQRLRNEELTAELQTRIAEVAALTRAAEQAEADKADAEAALASLEQRTAALRRYEAEREELAKTTLTLRERVAALELSLEERRKEAEETLLLLAAAEKKAAELSEDAKAAAERLSQEERLRAFAQAQLSGEQEVSAEGRQAVALLNAQIRDLRTEISGLRGQLDEADARDQENQVVIQDLGQRLNRALAQKVNELQRYRSEFFGRLRDVLGERDDIRVVGDRFVFQSEVLFAQGSAQLGAAGQRELSKFAAVIRDIAPSIPDEVSWILRVDGHTDRAPITGGRYRNNWELSQARALSVVEYLISVEDLPPDRLAATGFGEYQPLDPAETREAYAKNRRIELKLTER